MYAAYQRSEKRRQWADWELPKRSHCSVSLRVEVELDWKERRVLVSDLPAYVQARDTVEGAFLPPYASMSV